MHKVTVITLFCVFLSSGLVFSQTSPMVVKDNILTNAPLYYNHTPNIARSSNDDLIAVWTSGEGQIVFSKYDPIFMMWLPPVPLSNAGDLADKAGIAADDAGNLYCVWQQRETSDQDFAIFFTKYDGNTWSAPVNLTGNDAENEEASIEVSDQGVIFVAWNTDAESDGAEFVYCITSKDGGDSWSVPQILSSADGIIGGTSTTSGRPFLARATAGKMVCAWHEEPDGHPDRESFINQFDGSSWMGEIVNINVADSANTMYPCVGVNSKDEIYMMYVSFVGMEQLLMKKKAWDDAGWPAAPDVLISGDDMLTKPVLGIDSNDNMYLAFRRDNADDEIYGLEEIAVMTSSNGGITWSEQALLSRENYDAGYVTLAPRIRESGVDLLWRESYMPFLDDADTTTIMYGHIDLIITSVESAENQTIVKRFKLNQNYPNPFNPTTNISYSIVEPGIYELAIFNMLGQKIRLLESKRMGSGHYTAHWDATNDSGNKVASGIYFYRLSGKNFTLTKKMILVQ